MFSSVLEDIFVLQNKDQKNPEIFGLFSTTRSVGIRIERDPFVLTDRCRCVIFCINHNHLLALFLLCLFSLFLFCVILTFICVAPCCNCGCLNKSLRNRPSQFPRPRSAIGKTLWPLLHTFCITTCLLHALPRRLPLALGVWSTSDMWEHVWWGRSPHVWKGNSWWVFRPDSTEFMCKGRIGSHSVNRGLL